MVENITGSLLASVYNIYIEPGQIVKRERKLKEGKQIYTLDQNNCATTTFLLYSDLIPSIYYTRLIIPKSCVPIYKYKEGAEPKTIIN